MGSIELFQSIRNEAIEWSRGKSWYVRLPLLIYFCYCFIRHISDPMYGGVLSGLNLGIHELGHFIFCFMGSFLAVAGGTIFECAVPVFAVFNFYRQGDFFAIALSFGWLSTCFFDVARYVADARLMELPLVSAFGGEDVVHDWNYLLSRMNMLQYNDIIAMMFKLGAIVSMSLCLIAGTWLLRQMMKNGKRKEDINSIS